MSITWTKVREELNLTPEEEQAITLERELIKTMVEIREKKGITQTQLAERCKIKQPMIARIESSTHSPRIVSLLKVLIPMGYTLQIVPLKRK